MLNLVALMSAVNRFQTPIMFAGVAALTFTMCIALFDSRDANADAMIRPAMEAAKQNITCNMNVTGLAAWECLDKIERQRLGY